jgi:hypothetical protein
VCAAVRSGEPAAKFDDDLVADDGRELLGE